MTKKVKFGTVVLCEYVAQGANGKPTLVNVYSGNIVVATMPANIPLALFAELLAGQPMSRVHLQVRLNGKPQVEAELAVAGVRAAGSTIAIPQFPLRLEADSDFDIIVTSEGYAPTTILSTKIFKGHVPGVISPNASPPPSEQSPPGAPAS